MVELFLCELYFGPLKKKVEHKFLKPTKIGFN